MLPSFAQFEREVSPSGCATTRCFATPGSLGARSRARHRPALRLLGQLARGADNLVSIYERQKHADFGVRSERAPIWPYPQLINPHAARVDCWRRNSYPPFLLGRGIGQRAGELCKRESGRCVPSRSADTIRGERKASGGNSQTCRLTFAFRRAITAKLAIWPCVNSSSQLHACQHWASPGGWPSS